MSTKIEEILSVIEYVRDKYSHSSQESVKSLRIKAENYVADQRGLKHRTTVSDKYRRWLAPLKGTKQFNEKLEQWLVAGSNELRTILCLHCSNDDERRAVDNTFEAVTKTDQDLAEEFGYNPHDDKFKEGRDRLEWHRRKERNKSLIDNAKKRWKQEHAGQVVCTVCGFSFLEFYGDIGEDYIEAHHKLAISQLTEETYVGVEDLAPVCSNCHRMLHRRPPGLLVEELRAIIIDTRIRHGNKVSWTV